MTDRFVQQNAWPARAEHHRHAAGRSVDGFQIHPRLAQGFVGQRFQPLAFNQLGQIEAPTAAGITLFAPAVLLQNQADIKTHQGPHIGRANTVAAGNQYRVDHRHQTQHHLADPAIGIAHITIHFTQQLDLGLAVQTVNWIDCRV